MNNAFKIAILEIEVETYKTADILLYVILSGSNLSEYFVFEIVEAVCALETMPEALRVFIHERFATEDWRLLSPNKIQFGHDPDTLQ